MKKQISRISVAQTSKVAALLYVIFSLLYTLIGILMVAFGGSPMKVVGFIYIFMPVLAGTLGYLFAALGCWLYNVVAKKVGGVEFEVTDVAEPSSDAPVA